MFNIATISNCDPDDKTYILDSKGEKAVWDTVELAKKQIDYFKVSCGYMVEPKNFHYFIEPTKKDA